VRLIEIRLLDGPNVYRLEPTVKVEVTVGRRRTWYGARQPPRYAVIRLGAPVGRDRAPRIVADLAAWVRRLHRRALGRGVSVTIHRTSEPGHWIVAYPWHEAERAETLARAALRLAEGPHRGGARLKRAIGRIRQAGATPPEWVIDRERSIPIVSISGTNGKSTTTRMISHLLREAGRSVGTTTSDGVLFNGQLVEEGDLTGPLGAQRVLSEPGVDVAVLETARGGIVLRGVGYESNEVAVLTNVSSDHLDLHGLHTLPELAEVKSVIARITRPEGTVVLNADDPLVAEIRRRVRAPVCFFSLLPTSRRIRAHLASGGRAMVLEDGWLVEATGTTRTRLLPVAEVPSTLAGVARHNVANALAAAGAALSLGATPEQVAAGLRTFHAGAQHMPGRLNLHRSGKRLVIVDFAHNEAGVTVLFDMAEAILGPVGRRVGSLTAVVGTAGDRPDDTLRGIGRIAAQRADELAIKETQRYLRGRSRQSVIGELRTGMRQGGLKSAVEVPVYIDEPTAVRGELSEDGRLAALDDGTPRIVLLMCHVDRLGVEKVLAELGFAPLSDPSELKELRD
jgi:cyanophycin synthetase